MTASAPRVAVGGFQHETNTFAPVAADIAAFEHQDAWPALVEGVALPDAVDGYNIPIAGFLAAADRRGWRTVPTLWASATPSGPVTRDAYERIVSALLDRITAAGPLDAVYLDLHGAMVAEHLEDGEGELLARLRARLGRGVPVVASLDLHANVSSRMMELASALVAYRTYPHIDMAATGERSATLLERVLGEGEPARAWRQIPFLIPLGAQRTAVPPLAGLIAQAEEAERAGCWSASVIPGFPCADVPDCGPSVIAFGGDAAGVRRAVDGIAERMLASEPGFVHELLAPAAAIARALELLAGDGGGPVVLADTQDNPGAGGTGDTVGLINALVDARVDDAVVALLHDPGAARAAHEAGCGARIERGIGAGCGFAGEHPVPGPWRVEALGDGHLTGTGPFYHGCRMALGPMAVLARGGVRVVVASRNQQAADREMLRCVGIEPARHALLALKSSVHFRADFEPIARAVISVASPGAAPADPGGLEFARLRPGVRKRPDGAAQRAVAGGD